MRRVALQRRAMHARWSWPRGTAGRRCRSARRPRRAPSRPRRPPRRRSRRRRSPAPSPRARSAAAARTCRPGVVRSSREEMPRWPPASRPCAIDRVDAARFEPARLVDGGGRREDLRAPAAHAREQFGRTADRSGSSRPRARTRRAASAASALNGSRPGPAGSRPDRCRTPRSTARAPRAIAARAPGLGAAAVAEEVHVERPCVCARIAVSSPRMRVDREHRARQRAQAARVAHRDRQRAALHAGHRRLDDRELDAEQLAERHVAGFYRSAFEVPACVRDIRSAE